MEKIIIEGGVPLCGEARVHGAKNSVLPILSATVLVHGSCRIENCPQLSDVAAAIAILEHLGCTVGRDGDTVYVDAREVCRGDVPDELMRRMRSSIVFLGAIAARTGGANLSFPGGCELGPRPIDLHLAALRRLGLHIEEQGGSLCCHTPRRLRGTTITLAFPSVGATENVLLAAVTAEGVTTIHNAAREPEIVDLCAFLTACGAHIRHAGESTVEIEGVAQLHGCTHRIIPDRIETVTYLAAAAVTGSTLLVKQANPAHLCAVLPLFEEMGCTLTAWDSELLISAPPRLHRVRTVRTLPYPGFPTDAQALVMAATTVAAGTSVFVETMFESRYNHVSELLRLGARIKVEGRVAVVEGTAALSGAAVACTDLRGGAALVVAALAAEGVTEITELHHLYRGYDGLADGLSAAGARIATVP